ncbi:neuroendocrine convertase 2-like [Mytilus trossulus]|uniref:neuroendocrine convertase 2-like n=1 Tax=Mytilus trossulus TaxID=6551 RepID=UPI003006D850
MKFFFVIVLIQINYLISGFEHVERLDNEKEDNDPKKIKRVNVKNGEFTNRIVFTTTREDDPNVWFNKKYPQYEYIGQFLIGKTKYITAQIRQSKTKEALSTLSEDQDVNVLRQNPEISWVTQEKAHTRRARTLDTKWPILWYLNGDVSPSIKIDKAWAAGYSGKGITIAVLDDGLQTDHPDLAANIDTDNDKDFYDYDDDPRHEGGNSHGTECSGLIGAVKDNNICVVGVAFSCTLIGIRILGDRSLLDSDEAQALNHFISKIDIYSNSWGPGELTGFEEPGPITKAALQNGVTNGRNGKGSIYIWAAGNGGTADNCNADGYANSIYTVTITGVQIGKNAWYSEVCAPALAAAYGGSEEDRFMVDKNVFQTTTTAASGCKTEGVQGTSYAAPIATGIAALTLEANPNLTWRDIQHLIVFTSNRNGFNDTYSEWSINGANREFSQVLGFGLLDAEAMVKYGKHWVTVPTQKTCSSSTSSPALSTNTSASDSITITSGDCSSVNFLEHVVADITFSYTGFRGVTQLYLVSPSGTRSHLLHYRYNDAVDNEPAGTLTWTFMSVHFWMENPIGSWSLEISSYINDIITVSLDSWSLTLYGTSVDPWPSAEATTSSIPSERTTTLDQTTTQMSPNEVSTEPTTQSTTIVPTTELISTPTPQSTTMYQSTNVKTEHPTYSTTFVPTTELISTPTPQSTTMYQSTNVKTKRQTDSTTFVPTSFATTETTMIRITHAATPIHTTNTVIKSTTATFDDTNGATISKGVGVVIAIISIAGAVFATYAAK